MQRMHLSTEFEEYIAKCKSAESCIPTDKRSMHAKLFAAENKALLQMKADMDGELTSKCQEGTLETLVKAADEIDGSYRQQAKAFKALEKLYEES